MLNLTKRVEDDFDYFLVKASRYFKHCPEAARKSMEQAMATLELGNKFVLMDEIERI